MKVAVPIVREAMALILLGTLAGGVFGWVRGFPSAKKPQVPEGVCLAPVPEHPAIAWITQKEAYAVLNQKDVIFVDARDEDHYVQGHIPGALHVPFAGGDIAPNVVNALRAAASVVTYCDTGSECARSKRLALELSMRGVAQVKVLQGGMPSWLQNQYPAEAGECRSCQ